MVLVLKQFIIRAIKRERGRGTRSRDHRRQNRNSKWLSRRIRIDFAGARLVDMGEQTGGFNRRRVHRALL